MTYLLTGATGFIGSQIVKLLVAQGHAVNYLARKRSNRFDSQVAFHAWDTKEEAPMNSVPRLDAIIHLAGEPVFQRWSEETKRRIYASRVEGTRNLVSALGKLRHRPEVLITASAVGYYGDRGSEVLTEQSAPGSNFLAKVCMQWEAEAVKAREFGMRVVPVRFATVLGHESGAFPLLETPTRFGLGAKFGNGSQWMSWIHVKDLVDLLLFVAGQRSITGTLNGSSPEPVTNAVFTQALAHVLHRPAFLSVPRFAMRATLGEMSDFLFDSLRVLPAAVQEAGFQYRYGSLSSALTDLTND
jgi:hypothetical protein